MKSEIKENTLKTSINQLIYTILENQEQDNNKCKVMLDNKTLCNKKAYARILKTSPNVFPEMLKMPICKMHLEIMRASAMTNNYTIEESTNRTSNEKA